MFFIYLKNTNFESPEIKKQNGEAFAKSGDSSFKITEFTKENYKKADDESLGDFGERIAEGYYRPQGYNEFFAVQNKSGNGVDIVARNFQTGDMIKAETLSNNREVRHLCR